MQLMNILSTFGAAMKGRIQIVMSLRAVMGHVSLLPQVEVSSELCAAGIPEPGETVPGSKVTGSPVAPG